MKEIEYAAELINSIILKIRSIEGIGIYLVDLLMFIGLGIVIEAVILIALSIGSKVTQKTKSELDDEIIEEIKKKSKYLSFLLAAFLTIQISYGNIELGGLPVYNWFLIGLIIVMGASSIRIAELFFDFYVEEIAPKTGRTIEREAYHLIKNLLKYGLYVILAITVLGIAGVDITPMIAGLGVAGIAVAMALQDTLSNFFAGIYILLDRPVKLGDYVKIGDVEGVITDIGWRSAKIITWNNILVVIPNKKVAEEVIINYFKPTDPIVHVVEFGVEYGSDIEKVKEIVMKVITEMKKEGLVDEDQPSWVAFREFGDSSLNFKAGLCVKNYRKRYGVQAVFLERLYNEFNKEGIGIPFPTRTVYLNSMENETNEKRENKPRKTKRNEKKKKKNSSKKRKKKRSGKK